MLETQVKPIQALEDLSLIMRVVTDLHFLYERLELGLRPMFKELLQAQCF